MADFLPPVVAVLGANITEFKTKLAEARGEMSKTEHESSGHMSGMSKAMVAGFAVVGAGVLEMAHSSIDKFEEVASATFKLQTITGESAQSMSRLMFAAGEAGVGPDKLVLSLTKLDKQVAGNSKSFQKLGIETHDSSGKLLPMNDIIANAADKFASMPDGVDKTAMALQLFGKQGANLIPLLNKGKEGIAELEKESDKLGTTIGQSNVDAYRKNLMAHREMHAAWEGLQIQIGAKLMPILANVEVWFAKELPKAIEWAKSAVTAMKPTLAQIVAAFGEMVKWIKAHWTQIKADALAVVLFIKNYVLVPIGIAIKAMAIAIGDAVAWIKAHWTQIKADATNVVEFIKNYVVIPIVIAVKALADGIGEVVGWIRAHWDQISADATNLFNVTKQIFIDAFAVISTSVEAFISVFQTAWDIFGGTIKTTIGDAWDLIKGVFSGAFDFFKGVWDTFKALFTGDWSGMWKGIKEMFSGIWTEIKAILTGVLDGIKAVLSLAWDGIKAAARAAWDGVKGTLSTVWGDIKSGVENGVGDVVSFVTGLPGRLFDALKSLGTDMLNFGGNVFHAMLTGIQNAWGDIWGYVSGLPGDIVRAFGSLGGDLLSVADSAIRGMWSGIKSAWNWLADKMTLTLPSVSILGQTIGGGTISVLPHLAKGGTALTSGLAVVGEHGAEVVKLNKGDSVYPHGTMPAGAGGSGLQVVNNFYGITDIGQLARESSRATAWAMKTKAA